MRKIHLKAATETIIVSIIVISLMWLMQRYVFPSHAGAGTAAISLPATVQTTSGGTIEVPVTVTAGVEIIGADIEIDFDKNYLRLTEIIISPSLPAIFTLLPQGSSGGFDKPAAIQSANNTGRVSMGALSQPGNPNPAGYQGTVIVGTLIFTSTREGSTNVTVNFQNGATNDSNLIAKGGGDILTAVTSTAVTIGSLCPKLAQGDSDCDGVITIYDFESWRAEYLKERSTTQTDFNKDGTIDLVDFETWRENFQ